MYFIERRGPDHQWIRELIFKTEFKALIGARRKAISTLATYRDRPCDVAKPSGLLRGWT